jgi:hypothetical protein
VVWTEPELTVEEERVVTFVEEVLPRAEAADVVLVVATALYCSVRRTVTLLVTVTAGFVTVTAGFVTVTADFVTVTAAFVTVTAGF